MSDKWDRRFLGLAMDPYSTWSKDPSTQVGAVITRGNRQVSQGYNGFPAGVDDSPDRYADREFKYRAVIHAEANAIIWAQEDLTGCTIYVWPMPPCGGCAGKIIQAGILRVVTVSPTPAQLERWGLDIMIAQKMFEEAGVEVVYLNEELNEK